VVFAAALLRQCGPLSARQPGGALMRLWPSYPLLGKELIEAAVRRRTYILRAVYALLLVAVFALVYSNLNDRSHGSITGMLGSGRQLFEALFYCQSVALLIIMPAVTATTITAEKEAGTLTSLLLTAMSPTTLILQKWFSRLVLVGSYLLLSVPLLGVAYAYGGLSTELLIDGIYLLVLTCLQCSAVALMVSSFFRSSVAAFVMSYIVLGFIYGGAELYNVLTHEWFRQGGYAFQSIGSGGEFRIFPRRLILLPPVLFEAIHTFSSRMQQASVWRESLPILVTIVIPMVVARFFFVRRAHIAGMNPLLALFRRIDRMFERADAVIGRKASDDVPVTDPVAWREFNRRSLANWRYLIRIMLPITAALVFGLSMMFASSHRYRDCEEVLSACVVGTFGLAILLFVALAASLVAGERANQTLDVLLTTPMSARDILAQKVRGLRRLHYAMLMLVAVLMMFRWYGSTSDRRLESIVIVAINAAILPAMFTWFAIWIGLRSRHRNRAVIVAVIATCLWICSAIPLIIIYENFHLLANERGFAFNTLMATPAMALLHNEFDRHPRGIWTNISVFLAWHLPILWFMRRRCFANADRYLRAQKGVA
jgi:ABC-type transport system involved in multi-copper enzyme maturation permease subunit